MRKLIPLVLVLSCTSFLTSHTMEEPDEQQNSNSETATTSTTPSLDQLYYKYSPIEEGHAQESGKAIKGFDRFVSDKKMVAKIANLIKDAPEVTPPVILSAARGMFNDPQHLRAFKEAQAIRTNDRWNIQKAALLYALTPYLGNKEALITGIHAFNLAAEISYSVANEGRQDSEKLLWTENGEHEQLVSLGMHAQLDMHKVQALGAQLRAMAAQKTPLREFLDQM